MKDILKSTNMLSTIILLLQIISGTIYTPVAEGKLKYKTVSVKYKELKWLFGNRKYV